MNYSTINCETKTAKGGNGAVEGIMISHSIMKGKCFLFIFRNLKRIVNKITVEFGVWTDQGRSSMGAIYSHSMVPGGLDVMSYTTRLTPGTSLMIRVETFPRNSCE